MAALKYWVWLATLPGLSHRTRLQLLEHFDSPEDIYYADEGELLLTEGMTREQAALLADHDLSAADRILADCQRLGLTLLTLQDAAYPGRLKNIYDPPCGEPFPRPQPYPLRLVPGNTGGGGAGAQRRSHHSGDSAGAGAGCVCRSRPH